MGLKAAIQALKQAEELKVQVQVATDLLNNTEAWQWQSKLQGLYQQVLLLDLEFALDRKAEQELWSFAFKHFISALQLQAKDANNWQRNEAQAMLVWFLDSASGFYLSLLQEICSTFSLDLPFRRKDSVYGQAWKVKDKDNMPQHSSCLYVCQHCLVHLGDIARYRGAQTRQAEAFYRHAVLLAPGSGQPYNQLALLSASRGDQLSTVFHYVRSIAVRHPFPAAATNLERTLKRCADLQLQTEGKTRMSASELVSLTLKLHGLLRCRDDVSQAQALARTLTHSLTALVATQAFSAWKLVQMLVVHIYLSQQASERQRAVIVEVIATCLSAYLLPVYTLSQQEALLGYFALPAVKVTLEWLVLTPSLLMETGFADKRQIWPSLCQLLNALQTALAMSDTTAELEQYNEVPLPEDKDLQGFLPLNKYLSHLRFEDISEGPEISMLRASRLVKLGLRLAKTEEGSRLLLHQSGAFVVVGQSQCEPAEILRELEELNLEHTGGGGLGASSPVLSDTGTGSSWGTGKSTPDSNSGTANLQGPSSSLGDLLLLMDSVPKPREDPPKVSLLTREVIPKPTPEKSVKPSPVKVEKPSLPVVDKVVIAKKGDDVWNSKPRVQSVQENSVDKTAAVWGEREATPGVWSNSEGEGGWPMPGRMRQNVAMQAILRSKAQETERQDKQVTFKTPSPSVSPAAPTYDGWKSPLELLLKSQPPLYTPPPNTQNIFPPQQQNLPPPPLFPPNLVPPFPPPPTRWETPESQLWSGKGGWGGQQEQVWSQEAKDWSPSGLVSQQSTPYAPRGNVPPRLNLAAAQAPLNDAGSYSLFSPPPAWCISKSEATVGSRNQSQLGLASVVGQSQLGLSSVGHSIGQPQLGLTSIGQPQAAIGPRSQPEAAVGARNQSGRRDGAANFNAAPLLVQPPVLQSLWSGPSPSPLERLLEQQRQQREGGT